jgi:hypothetical protein
MIRDDGRNRAVTRRSVIIAGVILLAVALIIRRLGKV